MLQALSDRSDELLVAGDSASSVLVKVRESELGQRLTNIQQLLMSHELQLGSLDTQSVLSDFRACTEQVEMTLRDVVLADDADEATLTTVMASLEQSLAQLVCQPPTHLTYVSLLDVADSERFQHLYRQSRDLLCRTKDQCRAVQRQLLTHYDMACKCHAWLQFVAQIEHELSCPLASNIDSLLAQQKMFEASSVILLPLNN